MVMRFDPAPFVHQVQPASAPAPAKPNPKPVKPLSYRSAENNPYRHWLMLLCFGAAFGCGAYLVDASWSMAILGRRVRGFPSPRLLRTAYPFLTLATVALTWVSVWLL